MTAIGEVTSPIRTWDPTRNSPPSEFDYIDLSAVDNAAKKVVSPVRLSTSGAPSRARQIVAAGDVLVSTVRPNLNAVAAVPAVLDGATASTGFTVLRPTSAVHGRYLFHWVCSPAFIRDMVRKATGASYPAVSDRIVKESIIQLPPLEEQRRIAAILDRADDLRSKRAETLQRLGALSRSLFSEMFSHTSHEWLPMAPLADVVRDGTIVTYGIVQAGPEHPGGVPYIRTGDLVDGEIAEGRLRRTEPTIAARFQRSRVEKNDIVMSIRATVGTTALVPASLEGANLTQGTARIAPGPQMLPEFLLEYLRSSSVQSWIQRQVKGATFREITLKRLRELPIIRPPVYLQEAFAERLRRIGLQRQACTASDRHLALMSEALSRRAFAGAL